MYGVSEDPAGWATAPVAVALACGAVLLGALIVVELRKESPMIDVRILTDRLFASGPRS